VLAYVARRLVLLVVVLFGVSVLTFAVSHWVPADAARNAAGMDATAEQVQRLRVELGLDQPTHVQYLRYAGGLLRGDLGISVGTRRPVREDLAEFFPATFELVLVATTLMMVIGVPLGVISAVQRGKLADVVTRLPAILGTGAPIFWLGLMGQLFLYYRWSLVPYGGRLGETSVAPASVTGLLLVDTLVAGDPALLGEAIRHLFLPATVLAFARMAIITRLTRASLLETLNLDFVRTARAKGLGERIVITRHALKPAFIPVLTEFGLQFGWMLGGTVLVESIFAWPGIGRYAFNAIQNLDMPAIMGVTLLLATFKVATNLLIDILYLFVDPRIRLRGIEYVEAARRSCRRRCGTVPCRRDPRRCPTRRAP